MIKKLIPILFAATLMVGCATSGPDKGKVTPKSAVPAVKTAAYLGTALTIKKKPDTLDEFQMAHKQLTLLELQSTVDWTTLLAIVNSLPVKQLEGDTAQLIITSTFIILNTYADDAFVPVNKHIDDIHVIVKALREGLELGITAASP